MSEQLSLFDYGQLSPELAIEARVVADRVRLRMRRAAEDIIEIGKDLIEMKARLPHGSFLPWIKSEFGMTKETASKFMQVSERFGEKSEILTFNPSVLYVLSSPSTPEEVIDKAISKAESGEKVSVKEVQEWKKRAIEAEKKVTELSSNFQSNLNEALQRERDILTEGYETRLRDESRKLKEVLARLEEKDGSIAALKQSHEREIERLRKNPDPEMKKRVKELEEQLHALGVEEMKIRHEVDRTKQDLEALVQEKDNLESNTLALNMLLSAFDHFEETHANKFFALYSDRVSPEARDRKRATAARWRDFWIGVIEAESNDRRVQDVEAITLYQ